MADSRPGIEELTTALRAYQKAVKEAGFSDKLENALNIEMGHLGALKDRLGPLFEQASELVESPPDDPAQQAEWDAQVREVLKALPVVERELKEIQDRHEGSAHDLSQEDMDRLKTISPQFSRVMTALGGLLGVFYELDPTGAVRTVSGNIPLTPPEQARVGTFKTEDVRRLKTAQGATLPGLEKARQDSRTVSMGPVTPESTPVATAKKPVSRSTILLIFALIVLVGVILACVAIVVLGNLRAGNEGAGVAGSVSLALVISQSRLNSTLL